MAEVGSLTWVAEIQGIAESKREAEEMTEGLEGVAEQARETDAAVEEVGDSTGSLSARFGGLEKSAGFLAGGLSLLGGEILLLLGRFGVVGAAAAKFRGILAGLYAWIAGGLTGAISTLLGYGSAFISWLAAGSAGALAFAVAIGALIGLIVTWILEITGVLNVIEQLGVMLRDSLPGWARDAIIAVIGIFAGGLATLGGLILGFVGSGGDLEAAVETAKEVLQIFGEAFERLASGAIDSLKGLKNDLVGYFIDMKNEGIEKFDKLVERAKDVPGEIAEMFESLGEGYGQKFADVWNAIIPAEVGLDPVTLPSVQVDAGPLGSTTIGGQEIFGGVSFGLPQLEEGGRVAETGVAQVHEGETYIPMEIREALAGSGGEGGGGSGTTVVVEEQIIEIGDQSLDVRELDRGAMELLADLIAEKQGDKLTTLVG